MKYWQLRLGYKRSRPPHMSQWRNCRIVNCENCRTKAVSHARLTRITTLLLSLPMCLHVFNDNFYYSIDYIDFTDLQIGDLKSILIILTILKTAMGQVRQLSDTVLPNLSDYTDCFDVIYRFLLFPLVFWYCGYWFAKLRALLTILHTFVQFSKPSRL